MSESIHLLVAPHTHWDREWYLTFQQFRMRLVRTVDLVLETLESDPTFTHFMLDGQTIILEDYLEIRPENAERLERLIRQGRILIGPWYLQPDEFLVSGESLVRNLLRGKRMGDAYGGAMRVGYVPDTFGHIAQLPQILRGFGIDNAVFWRGVGPDVQCGAFRWAAPDGSDVLAAWLYDDFGYSNAAVLPLDPEALAARARMIAARMRERAVTNTLLLMNGTDHIEPQPGMPNALRRANALLAPDGLSLAIGTLPQYLANLRETAHGLERHDGEFRSSYLSHLLPGVLSTRMWLKQRNAAGEALLERWAEPAATWAWVLGERYPHGLLDVAWKHLLHCHPHDSICGCGIDQVHAEMMPRFAQSAQIAGEVADRAVTAIAARVDTRGPERGIPIVVVNPAGGPRTDVARCEVVVPFTDPEVVDGEGQVLPYQALSSHSGVVLDQTLDKQFLLAFLGMAEGGRAYGYSILHGHVSVRHGSSTARVELTVAQNVAPNVAAFEATLAHVQEVALREDITAFHVVAHEARKTNLLLFARDVPAYGGRVLFVRPRSHEDPNLTRRATETRPLSRSMQATPDRLENAHLRVTIDPASGTLTLRDKRTGSEFSGLNRFVDSGDVGDLYNYCPPTSDATVQTPAWPPTVELIEMGPARGTLRVTATYLLPKSCTPDRRARSIEKVAYTIITDVSLVAGARRVELRTTVENTAKDHRLRVLFPVPFLASYADAEDAFSVTRRPARCPEPRAGEPPYSDYIEAPVDTHPQKRFVDVSDGTVGLAVLNRGLPEYELLHLDGATSAVALTLLRCVEWLSRDDLTTRKGHAGPMIHTPEAQGLGSHSFEYALMPHPGTWEAEDCAVLQEAHAYEAPLRAHATEQHEGTLPPLWSFVHVTPGNVLVSAVKRAEQEDALIVRLVNPSRRPVVAEVILATPFRQAEIVNLAEERAHGGENARLARILSTGVRTHLRGGEIQTLLFRLEPPGERD